MYCPGCATEVSTEQRYCRSCGMDLQAVLQLLAGQPELQKIAEVTEPEKSARGKNNKFMMFGMMTILSSLIVGSLLLVFAGLDNFYPGLANLIPVVLGISGMLLFGGSALVVYSTFLPKESSGGKHSAAKLRAQPAAITKQQPGRLPETLMSVTEHTTELLDAVDSKIPARNTTPQSE